MICDITNTPVCLHEVSSQIGRRVATTAVYSYGSFVVSERIPSPLQMYTRLYIPVPGYVLLSERKCVYDRTARVRSCNRWRSVRSRVDDLRG